MAGSCPGRLAPSLGAAHRTLNADRSAFSRADGAAWFFATWAAIIRAVDSAVTDVANDRAAAGLAFRARQFRARSCLPAPPRSRAAAFWLGGGLFRRGLGGGLVTAAALSSKAYENDREHRLEGFGHGPVRVA